MNQQQKSICWIDGPDGQECYYQSGLRSLQDTSLDICFACPRFEFVRDNFRDQFIDELPDTMLNNDTLKKIDVLLTCLGSLLWHLPKNESEAIDDVISEIKKSLL